MVCRVLADAGRHCCGRVIRARSADGAQSYRIETLSGGFDAHSESQAEREATRAAGQVAIGSDGSIYFVDAAGTRVRRADPAGTVRTVAGNGVRGHSGDGGPAKSAAVSPLALAVDPSGVLYIAELYRIRKVDLAGTITTIAGTGERGFSGDGGPATAARISIVSSGASLWSGLASVANAAGTAWAAVEASAARNCTTKSPSRKADFTTSRTSCCCAAIATWKSTERIGSN